MTLIPMNTEQLRRQRLKMLKKERTRKTLSSESRTNV